MCKSTVVFVVTVFMGVALQDGAGFTTGNETLLRTELFTNGQYDVSVRPNGSTTVSLTLVPTSLNSIDIKAQTMSVSGWWVMTWTDQRLTWTPSKYGGISETHVFEDKIWTPTIVVYNSVNDLSAIDEDTIPLRLVSTGVVQWSPPGVLTVSCSTDVRYFPFDVQTCGVSVKTFGYTVQQLVLEADEDDVDLTYYNANGEWVLLDTWPERVDFRNYSQVTFYFRFRRKPEFYGMNLILPVVTMAVLSLFIFLLPAESGEKMGYSLTVMLTFVVLMTVLSDKIPSTADHTSFFEVYVIVVLSLCSVSVVLSIISLDLFFREEDQAVSKTSRDLTRFFLRMLCKEGKFSLGKAPRIRRKVSSSLTDVQRASPEVALKTDGAHVAQEVTWKLMSHVMDAFLFRLYIAVVVVTTVVFFITVLAS